MKLKHTPNPQHLAWTLKVVARAKALGIYPAQKEPTPKPPGKRR